jgi:CRISPR-associated protein Csd1
MILQALAAYYQRLIDEGNSEIPQTGFQKKQIPFIISIDYNGKPLGIVDTRFINGKKKMARSFNVPKVFEGSRTVNVKANLLWDKASYVFGINPKTEAKRLRKQREEFRNTILDFFPEPIKIRSVQAILNFLDYHCHDIQLYQEWEDISTTDPNIAFRIHDEKNLICNSPDIIEAINNKTDNKEKPGICLVSGSIEKLVRLENPIKGLRGAGVAESHWVAFNEPAYWSYGKNKGNTGINAPIGRCSSEAYVSALNYLQDSNSTQKIPVGDTTTVFWAEKKNEMENTFAKFFGWKIKDESEQDYKQLLALFHSPETGAKHAELDPSTKFFVLGLAPNAARIAVRFWYAGTVGDIADNIYQHFDDLEIVKSEKDWHKIDIHSLLKSTALQEKEDNVAPNLAGDIMKAILNGTPYPRTLLSSVLARIKAEQSLKDKNGKPIPNVNFTRAAMIKALLVRDARYYKQNNKEVTLSLDINNKNTGYLLGRLFAVLEKAQERANPGINATIRDRYYSAASSTPIAAFPSLMKLKNYHIAKLDNKGEVIYLEKMIGEIISKLGADTSFPAYLNLQDQGRFAVGYYHQRQDFYTKKENLNEKEGE